MKLKLEISEADLKSMILQRIKDKTNAHNIKIEDVKIEVKSKQNYKSEWEVASFRASFEGEI